jgi:hypothetical protein
MKIIVKVTVNEATEATAVAVENSDSNFDDDDDDNITSLSDLSIYRDMDVVLSLD